MKITATEFIPPYGEQRPITGKINDVYTSKVKYLEKMGGRITLEHLGIGDRIRVCIEHPHYGDFSTRIVGDAKVTEAVEAMLQKFTEVEFKQFIQPMSGELDQSDKTMKLLELYKKFNNTGVDGVVISDAELKELKEKLEEVGEFLSNVNLFNLKIRLTVNSV